MKTIEAESPVREAYGSMRGVRLALFTDTYVPQVNGVARTLEQLVRALRDRGAEVLVLTTDDPGAASQRGVVRFAGRAFWAYPHVRLAWPSQQAVRRELDAFQPTLIHVATEFGVGLAGRRAARQHGVPFVSSRRSGAPSPDVSLARHSVRRTPAAISCSFRAPPIRSAT